MDDKQKPAPAPAPVPARGGFGGGPMGGMRGGTVPKAKNMKKTLVRIFGYLRPYWWHLGFVAVCAVISTI